MTDGPVALVSGDLAGRLEAPGHAVSRFPCVRDPQTGKWEALSGVNITLGLPIVRTSVDHGTAFDIAGKNIANELSLVEAIDYAERLAGARAA